MKVYVVVIMSDGECRCSLDDTKVFTNREDAKKELIKSYREIIDWSVNYELEENEFEDNYYNVVFEDDNNTVYYGTIIEKEVE